VRWAIAREWRSRTDSAELAKPKFTDRGARGDNPKKGAPALSRRAT